MTCKKSEYTRLANLIRINLKDLRFYIDIDMSEVRGDVSQLGISVRKFTRHNKRPMNTGFFTSESRIDYIDQDLERSSFDEEEKAKIQTALQQVKNYYAELLEAFREGTSKSHHGVKAAG